MHKDRPSSTATMVAAVRALYTALPEPYRLTGDPFAAGLVPFPLALPAHAIARAPWVAPAIHHGLGLATLGLTHYVALRTRAIDDALREAVRLGVRQLVILGAGLDSRALRMDELGDVAAFEIDHPSTQRYKVARLAALAAPPAPRARSLVRVPVDFEKDRLEDALPRAGFDRAERSFWIWEGVVVYLSREAIADTLGAVASLSAPGSRLGLTYSPTRLLSMWAMPIARQLLDLVGEPFKTTLTPDELAELLGRTGFTVRSDESSLEWAARYWPGRQITRAVERLAVAERR